MILSLEKRIHILRIDAITWQAKGLRSNATIQLEKQRSSLTRANVIWTATIYVLLRRADITWKARKSMIQQYSKFKAMTSKATISCNQLKHNLKRAATAWEATIYNKKRLKGWPFGKATMLLEKRRCIEVFLKAMMYFQRRRYNFKSDDVIWKSTTYFVERRHRLKSGNLAGKATT